MLLTEKEAAEKECFRCFGKSVRDSSCVGSDCMAWRWGEWEVGTIKGITPRVHVYDDQKPTKGYCGLAGPVR